MSTTGTHQDVRQRYVGGEFITDCTCGHLSTGQTPDDADSNHLDHAEGTD